ncbi:MAG: hypothetical protein NTY83_03765 [Candidatus Micrarchaeota archaeon]|nr:hypothetical protein [Candidatus Micrarchaeota archaeon]
MNGTHRILSFPGTVHMPSCRVRSDSPHFGKFKGLANDIRDRIPDIETRELKAFCEEKAIVLPMRTGLMFDVTYTSTILKRVVESMRGKEKPAFYNKEIPTPEGPIKGTVMMPSFWEMVMLMREDFQNTGFEDMMALEEEGVLVRSRKVPIAIRAPAGGLCMEDNPNIYLVPGKAVPIRDVVMLSTSGAAGLLAEIIKVEAGYESTREGGPFFGHKEGVVRGMMLRKFRYEVQMSLSDTENPIDRLPPQS